MTCCMPSCMASEEVKAYYDAIYLGEPMDDADFPPLHARALDALDAATFGRWRSRHPPGVREAILRALCAQVEYLYSVGADGGLDGGSTGSYTVGHVSVNGGSAAGGSLAAYGGLCRRAVMVLAPTGLLYNGGDVLC